MTTTALDSVLIYPNARQRGVLIADGHDKKTLQHGGEPKSRCTFGQQHVIDALLEPGKVEQRLIDIEKKYGRTIAF